MIAVTGATGHIGNVLVRDLLARGNAVRVVVPPGEDISSLNYLNLEIVQGDVRDVDSLIRAFSGVEQVFHLAGIISIMPGKKKLLEEVNIKGTRNVISACLKTGVKRLLHTSSIHALKEPPHGTVITEAQTFDPENISGDYGKSKAQASLYVLKAVKQGLNAVIVCPTGVIGPYDYKVSEMGQLVRSFLNRKLVAYLDGAYDFVDVRDVASGMILAAEKGRAGESYILAGERITIPELMKLLEKITGVKKPALKAPCWLARTAGIMATPYYWIRKSKPLFTAYSVDVLASNSVVSSEKARRELGYSPRSIAVSMIDTVAWLKGDIMKPPGFNALTHNPTRA